VVWKGAEVEGREGGRWTLKWGSEEMPFDGMKGLGEDAKGSIGRGGQGAGGGGVNAGAEEPGGVRRKGGRDTGGTEAPVKMRMLAVGVVGVKLKSPHPGRWRENGDGRLVGSSHMCNLVRSLH
jgi:hypothetical protein